MHHHRRELFLTPRFVSPLSPFLIAITVSLGACHGAPAGTPVNTHAPASLAVGLHSFSTCQDLLAYYQAAADQAMTMQLLAEKNWSHNCMGIATPMASASAAPAASPSAPNHSTTNNQVAGVDEADILKTWTLGEQIYTAYARGDVYTPSGSSQAEVVFSQVYPVQTAQTLSRVSVVGHPVGLFVSGNTAVVFSQPAGNGPIAVDGPVASGATSVRPGFGDGFYGYGAGTLVMVIDISNVQNPQVVRTRWLSGQYLDARMVQSSIRLVTTFSPAGPTLSYWPEELNNVGLCGAQAPQSAIDAAFDALLARNRDAIAKSTLADYLPKQADGFHTADPNAANANNALPLACSSVLRPGDPAGMGTTQITTFSVANGDDIQKPWDDVAVLADGQNMYASATGLYIGTNPYDAQYWLTLQQLYASDANNQSNHGWITWPVEHTQIHRFALSDAYHTNYSASAQVSGSLINSFAMDEASGHFRVVANERALAFIEAGSSSSNVTVLSVPNLAAVGQLANIEPGEHLTAVRFVGDEVYLSTIKQTDPFVVVDLHNPQAPQLTATLPVPGDATYLQAIDANTILAVGYGTSNQGFIDGVQLSLYDVTYPSAPEDMHDTQLQGQWVYSSALYNHHALTLFNNGTQTFLALPVWAYDSSSACTAYGCYQSGIWLYTLASDHSFSRVGSVYLDALATQDSWGQQGPQRSMIMGPDVQGNTYLVAAGDLGLAVANVNTLATPKLITY